MIRDEAITVLQKIKSAPRRADGKSTTHTLETIAIDMAIEALSLISDNATNGETITRIINPDTDDCKSIMCNNGVVTIKVDADWWNAPCKK